MGDASDSQTAPDLLDDPVAFLRMGKGLAQLGRGHGAMQLAARAALERPADPLLRALAQEITATDIPEFHHSMLIDAPRNRAYRLGIEAAAPGKRVLDIGTGSGLLAMLAVRAGAEHVYACEKDLRLAATAQEIITANGLADRITVLPKVSTELDRERDLDGGVDLVLSEIFGNMLIEEGVLPSLRHAGTELCRAGAAILPGTAAIRVALAEFDDHADAVGSVEGFDLSHFNRHFRQRRFLHQTRRGLVLRSAAADLFAFDFAVETASSARSHLTLPASGGRITGVAQWIRFAAAPGEMYENAPGGEFDSHWHLVYYPLHRPIDTRPGQPIGVHGWRDDTTLVIWADE